jgi:hypothetical protein
MTLDAVTAKLPAPLSRFITVLRHRMLEFAQSILVDRIYGFVQSGSAGQPAGGPSSADAHGNSLRSETLDSIVLSLLVSPPTGRDAQSIITQSAFSTASVDHLKLYISKRVEETVAAMQYQVSDDVASKTRSALSFSGVYRRCCVRLLQLLPPEAVLERFSSKFIGQQIPEAYLFAYAWKHYITLPELLRSLDDGLSVRPESRRDQDSVKSPNDSAVSGAGLRTEQGPLMYDNKSVASVRLSSTEVATVPKMFVVSRTSTEFSNLTAPAFTAAGRKVVRLEDVSRTTHSEELLSSFLVSSHMRVLVILADDRADCMHLKQLCQQIDALFASHWRKATGALSDAPVLAEDAFGGSQLSVGRIHRASVGVRGSAAQGNTMPPLIRPRSDNFRRGNSAHQTSPAETLAQKRVVVVLHSSFPMASSTQYQPLFSPGWDCHYLDCPLPLSGILSMAKPTVLGVGDVDVRDFIYPRFILRNPSSKADPPKVDHVKNSFTISADQLIEHIRQNFLDQALKNVFGVLFPTSGLKDKSKYFNSPMPQEQRLLAFHRKYDRLLKKCVFPRFASLLSRARVTAFLADSSYEAMRQLSVPSPPLATLFEGHMKHVFQNTLVFLLSSFNEGFGLEFLWSPSATEQQAQLLTPEAVPCPFDQIFTVFCQYYVPLPSEDELEAAVRSRRSETATGIVRGRQPRFPFFEAVHRVVSRIGERFEAREEVARRAASATTAAHLADSGTRMPPETKRTADHKQEPTTSQLYTQMVDALTQEVQVAHESGKHSVLSFALLVLQEWSGARVPFLEELILRLVPRSDPPPILDNYLDLFREWFTRHFDPIKGFPGKTADTKSDDVKADLKSGPKSKPQATKAVTTDTPPPADFRSAISMVAAWYSALLTNQDQISTLLSVLRPLDTLAAKDQNRKKRLPPAGGAQTEKVQARVVSKLWEHLYRSLNTSEEQAKLGDWVRAFGASYAHYSHTAICRLQLGPLATNQLIVQKMVYLYWWCAPGPHIALLQKFTLRLIERGGGSRLLPPGVSPVLLAPRPPGPGSSAPPQAQEMGPSKLQLCSVSCVLRDYLLDGHTALKANYDRLRKALHESGLGNEVRHYSVASEAAAEKLANEANIWTESLKRGAMDLPSPMHKDIFDKVSRVKVCTVRKANCLIDSHQSCALYTVVTLQALRGHFRLFHERPRHSK